jgi:hypothetical protein
MAADPVLRFHLGTARIAARKYGVRVEDILAILRVEGGTSATGSPVAPGDGAGPPSFGQFTFGTGRALGVKFGNSASETDAVARYLVQLGYHKDRLRAFGAYNGGPGNPQMGYAAKVDAASKAYRGAGGTSSTGPATIPTAGGDPTTTTAGGELIGADKRSGLLKALTWVALVAGGLALTGIGITRTANTGGA